MNIHSNLRIVLAALGWDDPAPGRELVYFRDGGPVASIQLDDDHDRLLPGTAVTATYISGFSINISSDGRVCSVYQGSERLDAQEPMSTTDASFEWRARVDGCTTDVLILRDRISV